MSTFAGLWGIPFLENFYHISTLSAANLMLLCGQALPWKAHLGYWSSYQKKRLPPISQCDHCNNCSIIIFYHFPYLLLVSALLFILGMCSSAQAITFVVIDSQHPSTLGTASSIANTATIAAGLFQPLPGTF